MLTNYRQALSIPGAWRFSSAGLVARLPIAMIALGILLLVTELTDSYAYAGAVAAAFQISAAFGAIATSRLVDRMGQHVLLPLLAIVHAAGLIALTYGLVARWHPVAPVLLAVVAGATQPAIGSMVRARWAHVTTDSHGRRGGMAIESVLDELVFTLGPMITAIIASQVALPMPLVLAAVLALVGSLALAIQRRTEPPVHVRDGTGPSLLGALLLPGMRPVVIIALGIGGVFGSFEVSVVAFAEDHLNKAASGWILGLYALASMIAGIIAGAWHPRMSLPYQVILFTGALALLVVPVPFATSVVTLGIAAFVAGAAAAPALLATFLLTERLVPERLLTEGLTWTNSGLAMGYSVGIWVAGVIIDLYGPTTAFLLGAVSAGTSALVGALTRNRVSVAMHPERSVGTAGPLNDNVLPGPNLGQEA